MRADALTKLEVAERQRRLALDVFGVTDPVDDTYSDSESESESENASKLTLFNSYAEGFSCYFGF